tara:strand:- start:1836 stop:2072 length:237 start_codon:yes stop_codon:yes gene_type:complete
MNEYPCDTCVSGWVEMDSTGGNSCYRTCERLREYRRVNALLEVGVVAINPGYDITPPSLVDICPTCGTPLGVDDEQDT